MRDLDPNTGTNRIAMMRPSWTHRMEPRPPYMLAEAPRMKRTGWLARLCWHILGRIGALVPFDEKVHVLTYTHDAQKRVSTRMMHAVTDILKMGGEPELYAAVMGADEFAELCWDQEANHSMVHFRVRTERFGYIPSRDEDDPEGYHGYRASYHGISVHVVPFLSGVAMIPKVVIEMPRSRMPDLENNPDASTTSRL